MTIGSLDEPQEFSILELVSNNLNKGGLRLPQLTTDERTSLTESEAFQSEKEDKAIGLTIYNLDNGSVEFWDGSEWISLETKAQQTAKRTSRPDSDRTSQDQPRLDNKTSREDYSNENSFSLPFPRKLVRVEFTDVDFGTISKENKVKATMIYVDYEGSYFKKPVLLNYQGRSSMNYEKKNFAFDILNKDGSSCDIKIGNWAVMDSYNLKANYIDFSQVRNIATARLAYEAACTRPYGSRFPWEVEYSQKVSKISNRFDDGSRGVIDGFPMELYINGEYWGLYTFNIKKTRKNFLMKKKEDTKIILVAEDYSDFTQYIPEQWEFKNPDPVTSATLKKVNRIFKWHKDVYEGKVDFASTYQDYWIKDEWIDYFIFMVLFYANDCVFRNGLFCTWDGNRWAFKLYDLDTTWGLDWMGSRFYPESLTRLYPDIYLADMMPWKAVVDNWMDDVKIRYNELRKTVLHEKNVEDLLKSMTDIFGVQNYEKDAKRWPNIPSNGNPDIYGHYSGCYTGLYQLMDWYRKRCAFVDKQWSTLNIPKQWSMESGRAL